jgi:carboxypeptidase PM20D1
MRRAAILGAILVGSLALVLVVRGLALTSRQVQVAPAGPLGVEPGPVAEVLARAIRLRTVSHQDPALDDPTQATLLRALLRDSFPRVHQRLAPEVIGDGALLFTWPGSDASLPPLLLLAHQDVVPAENPQAWTVPPFEGRVAGGYVWGRGALDDKAQLVAQLQAVELLLERGFAPRRTVLLAYGHDEEVLGQRGAVQVALTLKARGLKPALILDEGMPVSLGLVPGAERPVALVGVAEKGYLSLRLTAEGTGGHSSMPPAQTAVGVVAAAVARLEADPFPLRLTPALRRSFDWLGPELPFGQRLAVANLWLLAPVVASLFAATPAGAASVRTTLAATLFHGGDKDNVLPGRAEAWVNLRLLPGDTVASATARVQAVIADARVRLEPAAAPEEASPESSLEGPGLRAVETAIREVFPDAAVSIAILLGASDARHYQRVLGGDAYRFAPQRMGVGDPDRVHGTDERIAVDNLAECVRFYLRLITGFAG